MNYRYSCRSELGKWFALWPIKLVDGQWAWMRVVYKHHVVRCFISQYFTHTDTYYDEESALMLQLKGWKDDSEQAVHKFPL